MYEPGRFVEITLESELRELLGEPMPRSATKDRVRLHDRDKDWLAASPFCFVRARQVALF